MVKQKFLNGKSLKFVCINFSINMSAEHHLYTFPLTLTVSRFINLELSGEFEL